MSNRWAEIAVAATGDEAQEATGALLTETAGCQGYLASLSAVTGYLPVDERLENTLLSLRGALALCFPDSVPEITLKFVAEEDWADAWKQYFKPQRISDRFVVKPTWEPFPASSSDLVIEIDPGMAFGTGLHATTRLCLRALEKQVLPGFTVADVGTGSGILAIGAALLGASAVEATDIDPLAVRIARENVAVNHAGDRITVREAAAPPAGTFQVVVANILADVILAMASALFVATEPGGVLIVSGIIESRAGDVQRGLVAAGYALLQTDTEGEWVAISARRA
ncbi:MAG: 50S ribosomal protein L11 methyltransferase [Cytophagales bacterium]|nr:50S ribosomal protein L11 methyltransferase [Armatimonadota bacterium]